MKKAASFFFSVFLFLVFSGFDLQAQENQFQNLEILAEFSRPTKIVPEMRSSNIKDIQVFGTSSGAAWTSDALFRTDNGGETWREIALKKSFSEKIGDVYFENETDGSVILSDSQNLRLEIAQTRDGGITWLKKPISLRNEDLTVADLENVTLGVLADNELILSLRLPTSSNFSGTIFYESSNNRQTWEFKERLVFARRNDETVAEKVDKNWILKVEGICEGAKTGCVQESKLFVEGREITPPPIKELSRIEKEQAKLQAQNSVFAQPPNGNTRISLQRGFDKCTAATATQMQTWWNNSPFYDANIYISGRNRGCSQPQLTAAWVNTVAAQGWGLIPTIVGYQSPCSVSTNSVKHSSDPVIAETQGRGEADIAITDANNLGLTQGTVLYYDMERYDDLSGTGACSTPTKAFLKGWTDRLHELGYISGVYGSPTNAVGDWLNIPAASRMDAVWLARWDNVPSVWFYASPSPAVPETAWANHQRIKQWQAPHNETWGGVTFNIDGNIADGPVAANQIAKNKRADFDGDGRTDISVWRPETGTWYVWTSSNSGYSILNFGVSTDLLAPGDFDGDGKTDFAVWRPENGTWHLYSRSIYRSFTFGTTGDIPAPADYDGDNRTDAAVFRPSEGTWYIWNSFNSRGNSYTIVNFGLNGDLPVPGDYDADGRADIAVYRPSTGVWYLLRSTAGFAAVQFGSATDKPVQADYDGDGKTDFAFYREGVWHLLQSTAGLYVTQFGLAGDLPAVGDFDGDGKSDIAVYRPAEGVWYILQSQSGVFITQFGIASDRPVPAAYMP